MHDYLLEILNNKKREIAALKTRIANEPKSMTARFLDGETLPAHKSFKEALKSSPVSVIAEVKRKSPSKGNLAVIRDPVELAKQYVLGGASAISVLTDSYGFKGSIEDLHQIANAIKETDVTVLQKDFILDEAQIAQAAAHGANAVLLIVAALGDKTETLLNYCKTLGIDALVEIHDRHELDYAVSIGAEIIGVNNRNLSTFEIDIENAARLKPLIPEHIIAVAESGISSATIAQRYAKLGYNALLIGETLVKSDDPKQFINDIRQIQ